MLGASGFRFLYRALRRLLEVGMLRLLGVEDNRARRLRMFCSLTPARDAASLTVPQPRTSSASNAGRCRAGWASAFWQIGTRKGRWRLAGRPVPGQASRLIRDSGVEGITSKELEAAIPKARKFRNDLLRMWRNGLLDAPAGSDERRQPNPCGCSAPAGGFRPTSYTIRSPFAQAKQ